jgi:retron-type reverse transcriptase
MEIPDFYFTDHVLGNDIVLKTNEDIKRFIKNKLSENGIVEIFNSYIIKHNIIGIDNIDNNSFWKNMSAHVNHIVGTINNYKYSPYIEKLISKGRNKEPRLISIPTIKDRIVLYVLKETLHGVFPECVNKQLINKQIKELLREKLNQKTGKIIKIDIKGFYNSINQQILLSKISNRSDLSFFLFLIEKAITNPTVPKKYIKTERNLYSQYLGIPQGLAVSNILANIYLSDFDEQIADQCKYYYRYVDDILLICDENNYETIYTNIKNSLQRIGLKLNSEKTGIIDINSEFTFLGYKISEQYLSVKRESMQKHINSLYGLLCYYKRLIEHPEMREKWLDDELLMNRLESELNMKITGAISENKKYGWVFYFSAINDMSVLFKLNKMVNVALTRLFSDKILNKLNIKSYVRAYHEIKENPKSGYIENYNKYDTALKKLEYLQFRGYVNKSAQYTEEEINYLFATIREKNLSKMLRDIGSLS